MNRRTSAALLSGGGALLIAVAGLLLLDVYVPATLPSIPENPVLSEEILVPVLSLGGAMVAWGGAKLVDGPPLLALPVGAGLAAMVIRLALGLATGTITAGAGDLLLGALQTFALGLAVGAVAAAGLTYPDRVETAGAAVLAMAGVVIASTAFGTTLGRVLYTILAALLGGAPIALGVPLQGREFRGSRPAASGSAGGADPGDPFGGDEEAGGGRAGGTGAAGGTATAGGEDRARGAPEDRREADASVEAGAGPADEPPGTGATPAGESESDAGPAEAAADEDEETDLSDVVPDDTLEDDDGEAAPDDEPANGEPADEAGGADDEVAGDDAAATGEAGGEQEEVDDEDDNADDETA